MMLLVVLLTPVFGSGLVFYFTLLAYYYLSDETFSRAPSFLRRLLRRTAK
jgi:hypothetical protein